MATYYVDASGGSDSNDGLTTGAPFLTLAKCVTVAAAGDTFNLKGTFRESADFRDKGNNITIQQWAGQTAAWIRGDTVVSSFTSDGGCYKKTIATGLTVVTVTVNWDTQVNSQGQHYGHLTKVASKGTCQATADSWYYDSVSGELDIRIGAGLDPAGYTVTYVGAATSKNGLDVGSTTSTAASGQTVRGLTISLWSYPAAGYGYGLRMFSCQNSLADGNTYHDCGYHSQGIVNYNGTVTRNVWEKNSSAFGLVAGGDSHYVLYSDTGGCDVESGFENCYGLLRPYLGRDGNPIHNGSNATMQGITTHTSDGTNYRNIKKFVAKDCTIVMGTTHASTTNRMNAFRTSGVADAGDPNNWRTYAAKFIRCHVKNGVCSLTKSNVAFVYCNWDFSLAGSTGACKDSLGGAFGDNATIDSANTNILWYGCDIKADLNAGASDHGCMFQCRGNTGTSPVRPVTLRFIGCSIVNTSTNITDAKVRTFFNHSTNLATSSGIYARQSIFSHYSPPGTNLNSFTWNNSVFDPTAMFDIKDCWYVNVTAGRYSSWSTVDSQAEWTSGVDANGIFGTVQPFLNPSGYDTLALNGYGKSLTKYVLPNIKDGINRRLFSKNYGAYQYGFEATTIPPL